MIIRMIRKKAQHVCEEMPLEASRKFPLYIFLYL